MMTRRQDQESTAKGVVVDNQLGNVHELKLNQPLNVASPDGNSPGILIGSGTHVPVGHQTSGEIVGFFATFCTPGISTSCTTQVIRH